MPLRQTISLIRHTDNCGNHRVVSETSAASTAAQRIIVQSIDAASAKIPMDAKPGPNDHTEGAKKGFDFSPHLASSVLIKPVILNRPEMGVIRSARVRKLIAVPRSWS